MERWKGFGFDMARVNSDVKRQTGTWGKLKTPQEVHAYLQTMAERPIEQTPIVPDRAIAKPPEPRLHTLASARVIAMKNGLASLYKANEYGIPTDIIETRNVESKASGRAYMCADCDERWQAWDGFISHALKYRINPAK